MDPRWINFFPRITNLAPEQSEIHNVWYPIKSYYMCIEAEKYEL